MKAKIQSWLANNTKVTIIVVVALLLTIFLVMVRAAGPHITFETETANIAGAVIKNSSSASGGKYVEFVQGSTSGPKYPGQPKPGTVLWGASQSGAADPWEKLEQPAGGNRVGIRRTFQPSWSKSRIDKMVSVAKEDVAVERIPWVSIKPAAWSEMANGNQDTLINYMLTELDKVQGPVWLTVHHEPDGGGGSNKPDDPGGPAMHVAMNRHIRQRMTALGTDNIALAPVLMSWSFDPRSIPSPPQENHRDANLWWEDGIYDFFGVDHYGSTALLTDRWDDVVTWAHSKGVDVAVGEWGTVTDTKTVVNGWYQNALDSHNMPGKARIVGVAYWDNIVSSDPDATDWRLTGLRLDAFREILAKPTSVNWPDINW